MSNRSEAARKAAATRKARKYMVDSYGEQTAQVLQMIVQGYDSSEISDYTGTRKSTVAAYKANVTRGTYGDSLHNCNW